MTVKKVRQIAKVIEHKTQDMVKFPKTRPAMNVSTVNQEPKKL